VGILVNKHLANHVKSFHFDTEGRAITVNMMINDIEYQFINVYSPNNPKERKEFILNLDKLITKKNVILGGDFNFVENNLRDKLGGNLDFGEVGKKEIALIKDTFNLIDPFRKLHPDVREYTWSLNNVSTRIDRFYISKHLFNYVSDVSHCSSLKSDHDIVVLQLHNLFQNQQTGPGFWHCNTSTLNDLKLQDDMKELWSHLIAITPKDTDWWEGCKLESKRLIIWHSTRIAKEKQQQLRIFELELRKLKQLERASPGKYSDEIVSIKASVAKVLDDKFNGNKIRSKAKTLDENERPSKYFLKKEKDNADVKNIPKLSTEHGEVTDTEDIITEVHSFYSKLYSEQPIDQRVATEFLLDLPQLSDEHSNQCEGSITKNECWSALIGMDNNKSPGSDGLPAEFYKLFFSLFGDAFVEFINYCFDQGQLAPSQKLGIISLICKVPKEADNLLNWRPISLLNVDYKIISKALTNRLSKVIANIVNIDQTCGIPGRSIQDNLHLFRNVLDYINEKDMECAFLLLDQAKAFDRVSHDFLFQALEAYNFGPDFIRWIKVLYHDISSQVLVNGFFTDKFSVLRSVRQGCSISPLLYVLFVEPFAKMIRKEQLITGIKLPGSNLEAKISQYADDTTVMVRDALSIKKVFDICDLFGLASGSMLNLKKCWGVWLGAWKHRTDAIFNIRWTNDYKKVCGLEFGNGDTSSANWGKILAKFEKAVNLYSMRNMSLMYKSNMIQMVLCSKLWYVGAVIDLPDEYRKKFERFIFKFFWGGKPEAVNRETMYNELHNGGLKIVNIELKIMALHVKHIVKIFTTDAKWRYFAIYWLGHSLRSIEPAFADNLIPHSLNTPTFYRTALMYFRRSIAGHPNVKNLVTKMIYSRLMSNNLTVPRVVGKYPRVDFVEVWKGVHHAFIDASYRDIGWRVAHHILPVGEYLYEKNITRYCCCYFCPGVETLNHLLVFCPIVREFWQFVERFISQYAEQRIKITANAIIFGQFKQSSVTENNTVLFYAMALGKYCIWMLRNKAKFEQQIISCKSITGFFISHIRLRILADFQRFNLNKFQSIWCKNKVLAEVSNDKVQIVLKPP
jgi:hypothetical protein